MNKAIISLLSKLVSLRAKRSNLIVEGLLRRYAPRNDTLLVSQKYSFDVNKCRNLYACAIIFLLIFNLVFFSAALADELALTLDEAMALSSRDNRDILIKAQDIQKAKEKIAEAMADIFPTIDFNVSRIYTRGLYLKDLGQTSTQATLKQYLYKGGKTKNTIEKNKYSLEVAEALLDKTKLETALSVKNAYYTLCLAEEFSNLNKDILNNAQAHLAFIQARYLNGESSESEVLKINEGLANVRQVYESSLNEAEAAESILKNLLYLDEEIRIKPEVKFTYEPMEIAYDAAFLKAMQERPEIKQYEAQIKADKEAIEIAKADTRPNIYASWDYYSRSTKSLTFNPSKDWQDYNVIGAVFSWPIFDGWLTKAKVEQAIIDLKQTQLNKERALKDIALELKQACLELKDALYKLKAKETELIVYQDNLKVTQEKYRHGISSSLDLEDANLSLRIAEFNQVQVTYDYVLAKDKFYKAIGEVK